MASKGIKDRVAIVGMGCTQFGEHFGKAADDLLVEAVGWDAPLAPDWPAHLSWEEAAAFPLAALTAFTPDFLGISDVVAHRLTALAAVLAAVSGYLQTSPLPGQSDATKFAGTSTRFAHAYTTFSNTFGAHLSMLTGTYPSRHDIRTIHRLAPNIPTLAEQGLQRCGQRVPGRRTGHRRGQRAPHGGVRCAGAFFPGQGSRRRIRQRRGAG